ncbi:MAG TPA: hypothetical protein VFM71_09270 [Gemmatimonadaceae bacterium]|nr:hypothetical protein [Gemmatimonadaceae bacterium]
MSHLSTDRLAAIADDNPTADEATHIAGCWDCRAELAAYRRLARLSAMAPVPMEPLTAWSQLAPRLRDEGLINSSGHLAVSTSRRRRWLPAWGLRAAAGVVLVLGGALVGRSSTGVPAFSIGSASQQDVAGFSSNEEAVRALTVAQQQYQSAAAFLAAQDTSARFIGMNRDAYQVRLAALDEIAAATRAALYRTPQDPMLNQYYLTTLGAREATIRQIGATMPDTRRLERY